MIVLIGTMHAQPIGDDVKRYVKTLEGWHVAIELDELRLRALLDEKTKRRPPGVVMGILYYVEKIIAEKGFGEKVGIDMLSAYNFAIENKFLVSLIDKPIVKIVGELSSISLQEKLKLLGEFLLYLVLSRKEKSEDIDLRKLSDHEDSVSSLLEKFKKRYPKMYQVLVSSRDEHLMRKIIEIEENYGNVVAFLGLAHVINIKEKFKDMGRSIEKIDEIKSTLAYRVY